MKKLEAQPPTNIYSQRTQGIADQKEEIEREKFWERANRLLEQRGEDINAAMDERPPQRIEVGFTSLDGMINPIWGSGS